MEIFLPLGGIKKLGDPAKAAWYIFSTSGIEGHDMAEAFKNARRKYHVKDEDIRPSLERMLMQKKARIEETKNVLARLN